MTMTRPTWEQVLAAVEDDARQAADVVAEASEPTATPPVEWQLPALDLPPLAAMPPVPEHLRARVESLREQIRSLQDELAGAMRDWQPTPRMSATAPAVSPRYVDTRA
jgi:uncharacterized protein YdhG (YjbR/CyaY superfamily)